MYDLCMAVRTEPPVWKGSVDGGILGRRSGLALPFVIRIREGRFHRFEVGACLSFGSLDALAAEIETELSEDGFDFQMLCVEEMPRWKVLGEIRRRLEGLGADQKAAVAAEIDRLMVRCAG